MIAIQGKGVSFSYDGERKILDHVDFRFDYGKVNLLSGHSGEGKSTLMYLFSGIIPNIKEGNYEGKVLINGEDIKGKKVASLSRFVGTVLQNADEQIVHKIVEDELAFGCENLNFAPEKTKKQIEIVSKLMKLDLNRKTRTLSGGEKQRLVTASTLAMGQRILVLDEPLANLDREGAHKLMGTLTSLAKAGYCVILIEHRLDVVLSYAEMVYHLEKGKLSLIEDKESYLKSQTSLLSSQARPISDENILRLDNISHSFKKSQILKNLNLDIKKGERLLLVGENGSGKTTMLRILSGILKPKSGKIIQNPEHPLGKVGSRAWFRKVGYVFQNPDYQIFMDSVEKEIRFANPDEETFRKLVEAFALEDLLGRHPQSLSEGEKRRLSIASVLASSPEVLLLDEPTVGMDYEGLVRLVDILNEMHLKLGNTMVSITHDLRVAKALTDEAYLLKDGSLAKLGGPTEALGYFLGEGK